MTAYRQQALACAALLANGHSRPRDIKVAIPDAPKILLGNVYGWFVRVERGVYALTDEGRAALIRWPQTFPMNLVGNAIYRSEHKLWKPIARTLQWRKPLATGLFTTVDEIAAVETITTSYVGCIPCLTLLAPNIVEAPPNKHGPRKIKWVGTKLTGGEGWIAITWSTI
jgi:hypothetical protein